MPWRRKALVLQGAYSGSYLASIKWWKRSVGRLYLRVGGSAPRLRSFGHGQVPGGRLDGGSLSLVTSSWTDPLTSGRASGQAAAGTKAASQRVPLRRSAAGRRLANPNERTNRPVALTAPGPQLRLAGWPRSPSACYRRAGELWRRCTRRQLGGKEACIQPSLSSRCPSPATGRRGGGFFGSQLAEDGALEASKVGGGGRGGAPTLKFRSELCCLHREGWRKANAHSLPEADLGDLATQGDAGRGARDRVRSGSNQLFANATPFPAPLPARVKQTGLVRQALTCNPNISLA